MCKCDVKSLVFDQQNTTIPQIPLSTPSRAVLLPDAGLMFQNINPELFLHSPTHSVLLYLSFSVFCTSLLWLWSSARHSWNTGHGLVCHSVVWLQHISIPSLTFPCSLFAFPFPGLTRVQLMGHGEAGKYPQLRSGQHTTIHIMVPNLNSLC